MNSIKCTLCPVFICIFRFAFNYSGFENVSFFLLSLLFFRISKQMHLIFRFDLRSKFSQTAIIHWHIFQLWARVKNFFFFIINKILVEVAAAAAAVFVSVRRNKLYGRSFWSFYKVVAFLILSKTFRFNRSEKVSSRGQKGQIGICIWRCCWFVVTGNLSHHSDVIKCVCVCVWGAIITNVFGCPTDSNSAAFHSQPQQRTKNAAMRFRKWH